MKEEKQCIECYKIRCKQCGWEACDADVKRIQKKELTACPVCGWRPEEG